MKHLKIHELPFKNVIVLAIKCKIYLKTTALVAFQNSRALRREENKVEFLEGRFLDEKAKAESVMWQRIQTTLLLPGQYFP